MGKQSKGPHCNLHEICQPIKGLKKWTDITKKQAGLSRATLEISILRLLHAERVNFVLKPMMVAFG